MSSLPSEQVGIAGVSAPASLAAASVSSPYISAADFHAYMAIISLGVLGVSASVTAKLEQATSSGGAGNKDITGSDVTALTGVGGDSGKQAIINVRPHQLDTANGFTHFRLTITNADDGASPTGVASLATGVVLGVGARHGPASARDVSTVDEIITV